MVADNPLLAHRDVEAGLLVFVLDVDTSCALFVEEDLTKNQFQIILVHVLARARYLIKTEVCQVEGGAIVVARVGSGIDVTTALQLLDIILGAEHAGDIELIMRQTIALQDIRELGTNALQLLGRSRHEVRDGVREGVHDIVVVTLDE